MSEACGCGQAFRTAEDYRDHLPCGNDDGVPRYGNVPEKLETTPLLPLRSPPLICPYCTARGNTAGEAAGNYRATGSVADTVPPRPHKIYVLQCTECDFAVRARTRDSALAEWNAVLEHGNALLALFLKREQRAQTPRPAAAACVNACPPTCTPLSAAAAGGSKMAINVVSKKPPLDLINLTALEAEAYVCKFGNDKYEPWDWALGQSWSECARAALSHVRKFLAREDLDEESGLEHLAHARARIGFLLEFVKFGTGIDDRRPLPEKKLTEGSDAGGSGKSPGPLDEAEGGG